MSQKNQSLAGAGSGRGLPRRRRVRFRPAVNPGRLGGLATLAAHGRSHFVELQARSAALRRGKPTGRAMKVVHLRMGAEDAAALRTTARRHGLTVAALVREVLGDFLAGRR